MTIFRPMLAGKVDFASLRFPLLASVKIDGLRCIIRDGAAYSRSQKLLPNKFLQDHVRRHAGVLNGFDGEIVVGPINAPDVYRTSVSGIMTEIGEPDFTFWVFDVVDLGHHPFKHRYEDLQHRIAHLRPDTRTRLPNHWHMASHSEVDEFEAVALADGHEGIMLRCPHGTYKQGRATTKGQELLKVKRYEDAEAVIVGVEEEMHNGNEATVSEIGRTKRSRHQENKTGKGTLGALVVKGLTAYPGIEFRIGTGFTAEQRAEFWTSQLTGKIVKFKHFAVGAKDAPRHPVFLGFRDERDMG